MNNIKNPHHSKITELPKLDPTKAARQARVAWKETEEGMPPQTHSHKLILDNSNPRSNTNDLVIALLFLYLIASNPEALTFKKWLDLSCGGELATI